MAKGRTRLPLGWVLPGRWYPVRHQSYLEEGTARIIHVPPDKPFTKVCLAHLSLNFGLAQGRPTRKPHSQPPSSSRFLRQTPSRCSRNTLPLLTPRSIPWPLVFAPRWSNSFH